jgi:anti-sigma factor RsiW
VTCDARFEQLSAFVDGELPAVEIAELTAHLLSCRQCVQSLAELGALRLALAEAIPEEPMSDNFLSRMSALPDLSPREEEAHVPSSGRVIPFRRPFRPLSAASIGTSIGAAAIAATLVFALMRQPDNKVDLAAVRDASLRTSLVSTATVSAKPASVAGYRVVAARYDIVAGHRASIVTYEGTETLTLCSWAANGESAHGVKVANYRGMTISYWNDGTTEFWAVGKVSADDMKTFVDAVHANSI